MIPIDRSELSKNPFDYLTNPPRLTGERQHEPPVIDGPSPYEWKLRALAAEAEVAALKSENRELTARLEVAREAYEKYRDELDAARKGLFHRITGWDKDGQTEDQILDELQVERNAKEKLVAEVAALKAQIVKLLRFDEPIVLQHWGPCAIWGKENRCTCPVKQLRELSALTAAEPKP